jgi:Na+-translocating ferredoxin:NAD+ oxidoreductase subunit G
MLRLSVVLTVISCAAALLIAVTNMKTTERIAEQQSAAQQEALERIMPQGVTITEKKLLPPSAEDSVPYWTGISGTDTVYAFKIGSRGYSSVISYLVCTTPEGTITGMTILDQSETPGLGSRVQETISKKYIWNGFGGAKETAAPWFSEQFKGISVNKPVVIEKTLGEWHLLSDTQRAALREKNGITAITGSTISTRAVTTGLGVKAQAYLKAIRG